jgi:hypothetical protein
MISIDPPLWAFGPTVRMTPGIKPGACLVGMTRAKETPVCGQGFSVNPFRMERKETSYWVIQFSESNGRSRIDGMVAVEVGVSRSAVERFQFSEDGQILEVHAAVGLKSPDLGSHLIPMSRRR